MSFDRIAHILHPRLMKFHRSLQLRGLMKHADQLFVIKSSRMSPRVGCRSMAMDIPPGVTGSIGYARPCRKASRMSMSFSKVFGAVSNSPASLAFFSSNLRWNAVIVGSSDFR